MAEFGLTPTGFNRKTLEEIRTDIENRQLTDIDPAFDVSADSLEGQLNGIFSSHLSEIWEILESANNSFNPQNAKDAQLDNVLELRGTPRQAPTKSVLPDCQVELDPGKLLAAGAVARVIGKPTQRFVSVVDVENTTGNPSFFAVDFEAETEGEIPVNISTIEIAEPQTGWLSVDNPNTTQVGRNKEVDSDYKSRSDVALRAIGGSTPDAIRGDVLEVEGVQTVTVLFNDDDIPDSNGVPGHAIEVVLFDGIGLDAEDDEIAQAIWDSKAAGIKAFGSSSGNAVDVEGVIHSMNFTRPTQRPVEMTVVLTHLSVGYAGDDAVKQALADYGNNLGASFDVIREQFEGVLFDSDAALGVWDKTSYTHNFVGGSPTTSNLLIAVRQISTYSVLNISVSSSVTVDT